MNIPAQAIEDAARILYAAQTGGNDIDLSAHRNNWINITTRILDAAAPHIAKEAWAEGVRDGERNAALGTATPNPYEETK